MNPYWTVNLSDSPFWKGRGAAGKVSRKAGGATAAVIEPLSALLSVESALGTRHEVEREAATSRPAKLQARILLAGQSPAAALGWLDAFTNCECRKSGAASMEARETETMSSSQSPVKPMLEPAERYKGLPTYTLAKVLQDRDEKVRQGVDVIDLGVGNPDLRPPPRAIEALKAALDDPAVQNHRYPSFNGLPEFRGAVAQWYQRRFGVTVDPATETTACVGSKEGISKFLLAHFDPGDTLLLCTPCYPAYIGQAAIAQIRVVEVPLDPKRGMLPDLSAIPTAEASRAKAIAVNFPNNPTAAVETAEFYAELLGFARAHELFVLSDIAYCDLSLDSSYRARSFLEFDRAKERTIEFHSFSKSYSMQ
ncbi:MAG: aminotransferase class I/II-fold pyridoxal phosphate-dependent enzyme, partial [Candidatus Eisenbacteria bacterium]